MSRIRLSVLIPLLLILSSLASGALLFWQQTRIAHQTILASGTSDLNATLTHLQNMLNTQLAADNLEDAKLSLAVATLHPGIRTLLLANETDKVLLANRYLWEGSQADAVSSFDARIARQIRQQRTNQVALDRTLLRGYYPVTLRIAAGGLGVDRVGVLFVEYDLAQQLAQARHNAAVEALTIGALMIAVTILVALLLHWLVSRRVEKIVETARRFAAGDLDARVKLRGNDELADIGQAFDHMAAERKQIEETIREFNRSLEQRVRQELARNREKDHMLIQQSRLAAMGEMVHNIAHQWRQPLNSLSIILSNIQDDYEHNELTPQSMEQAVRRSRQLLTRMSSTIDDFRDFFRPDREPGEFEISHSVDDALLVMDAALKNNNIQVEQQIERGLMAYGYANQFSQVILNILSNAKDAITHHRPPTGRIRIKLARSERQGILEIEDNGGGISEQALPKIFDPYFTTKEKGSGIGLYMSKMITERNLGGKIEASNAAEGALITITLPLLGEEAMAKSPTAQRIEQ